jgi:hypothetical protein
MKKKTLKASQSLFYFKDNIVILLCLKNKKSKQPLDVSSIFFILKIN